MSPHHKKQKRLERAGWRVGSASTFLNLTSVEEQLVEMKLSLGTRLRKARQRHNLTQAALADRMGSSQSRVAKMEAGDPTVSVDLLIQGLLAAGATRQEIADALAQKKLASAQSITVSAVSAERTRGRRLLQTGVGRRL